MAENPTGFDPDATARSAEPARARQLLARYVDECPFFWESNTDKRQCEKLWRHLAAIERQFGLASEQALDQVLAFAEARQDDRPCAVYISGRGGSGSHWLAEMLGDLGSFADAGEVGIPNRLAAELASWPVAEQGLFVDSVLLLHAWAGQPYPDQPVKPHPDVARLHVVNSNGDAKPVRAKLWDPNCVFVHLIRDPRDQVLSMTYRKPGSRQNYGVEDPADFLRLMMIWSRESLASLTTAAVGPDLVVRYEDLRAGAAPALRLIAGRAGADVDPDLVEEVAFRHSAEARRLGMTPLGNLSRTPTKTWRDTASEEEQLLMHSGLAEVVDTLGYEPDECRGQALEFAPLAFGHEVSLPSGAILGELHLRRRAEDGWERAGHAVESFSLPAGVMVRLRVPGAWTGRAGKVAELLPAGCLASLCLAANRDVVDDDVAALAGLGGLRELDLARTRVTDECLQWLTRMTDLRHVSLVGTGVSAEAVDRLRRKLPDCEVSSGRLITDALRGRRLFDEVLVTEPPR